MRIAIFQYEFTELMLPYLNALMEALAASDEGHQLLLLGRCSESFRQGLSEDIDWVESSAMEAGLRQSRADWVDLVELCQGKGQHGKIDMVIAPWELKYQVSLRKALKAARKQALKFYLWAQDYAKAEGLLPGIAYDGIGRRADGVFVSTWMVRHRLIEYHQFDEKKIQVLPVIRSQAEVGPDLSRQQLEALRDQLGCPGKDVIYTEADEAWVTEHDWSVSVNEFLKVMRLIHDDNDRVRLVIRAKHSIREQLCSMLEADHYEGFCQVLSENDNFEHWRQASLFYVQPQRVGVELFELMASGRTVATHHRRSQHHPIIEMLVDDRNGMIWRQDQGADAMKKCLEQMLYMHARRGELQTEAKRKAKDYAGVVVWVREMMSVLGV